MTVSLAHYLKDFSEPQTVEMPLVFDHDFDAALSLPIPDIDDVDPEAIRAEAYRQGHEAALLEQETAYAERLEEETARHRQEMDALQEAHAAQSADVIVARIEEMAAQLSRTIGQQTAAVLAPLLSEAIAAKAVDGLHAAIEAAVLDGEAAQIVVRGPDVLFAMLRTRMGEKAALLRHVDSPDLDLTVEIDGGVLVTRLSAWAASVKKVLE